jgi:prepilin-type N-terminal cleavage/methylation domain-containing protein
LSIKVGMQELNKKGFSLIEVIVALGIVTMVFAGTITLIVQVVNLQLQARNRTEAVAIAQRQMANAMVNIGGGCAYTEYVRENQSVPGTIYRYDIFANKNGEVFSYSGSGGNTIDESNFMQIRVVVRWTSRGINQQHTSLQLVRKE